MSIADHTDQYFNKTKRVIGQFGNKTVTYAVFMRRPVIFCPRIMFDWLNEIAALRGASSPWMRGTARAAKWPT